MASPYTKSQLISVYQAYRIHRGLEPIKPQVLDDAIDYIDDKGGIVRPEAGVRNLAIVDDLAIGILGGLLTDAIEWVAKQGLDAWKKRGSKPTYTTLDLTDAEKQKIADDLFAYVTGPGEPAVREVLSVPPGPTAS